MNKQNQLNELEAKIDPRDPDALKHLLEYVNLKIDVAPVEGLYTSHTIQALYAYRGLHQAYSEVKVLLEKLLVEKPEGQ